MSFILNDAPRKRNWKLHNESEIDTAVLWIDGVSDEESAHELVRGRVRLNRTVKLNLGRKSRHENQVSRFQVARFQKI